MSKSFARYIAPQARSFSLRLFNDHETEINRHFWSFKVISERAAFQARQANAENPAFSTATLFHASGADSLRVPPTVSDWLNARDELENWLRISALVSASSFLEVYLRQIVRSALLSDPLCRFGGSRQLDGVKLLKAGVELPYLEEMKAITRGDWTSRVSAYRTIFAAAPQGLTSKLATLEKIRKIRNDYAHGFGASVAPLAPTSRTVTSKQRVSQATFISYIGTISKVAAAIDADLLTRFIGSFELIYYYHHWRDQPIDSRDKQYDRRRQFKRSLIRDMHCETGPKYCDELIEYYDSV